MQLSVWWYTAAACRLNGYIAWYLKQGAAIQSTTDCHEKTSFNEVRGSNQGRSSEALAHYPPAQNRYMQEKILEEFFFARIHVGFDCASGGCGNFVEIRRNMRKRFR